MLLRLTADRRSRATFRARFAAFVVLALLCVASLPAADRSVDPIVSRIRRVPVESTALAAIGYSKRLQALEVEFRDGLIYRYEPVPPSV